MTISKLTRDLRSAPELKRKLGIQDVISRLSFQGRAAPVQVGMGDDAGAIRIKGGYLLLTADGIWPRYLVRDPYAAGRALVIANANDIYAMGGTPLAMVDVLSVSDPSQVGKISRGMREEAERQGIPIIGGHFHPDSPSPGLAGAAVGFARVLLASSGAKAGDALLAVYDLRSGRRGKGGVKTWDTHYWKKPAELRSDLSLIPILGRKKLARAAKDISNGGLITAVYQLLLSSKLGAEVNLGAIPIPEKGFSLFDWLLTFPSYGFLLSISPGKAERVKELFNQRNISCELIGKTMKKRVFSLRFGKTKEVLFDFSRGIR